MMRDKLDSRNILFGEAEKKIKGLAFEMTFFRTDRNVDVSEPRSYFIGKINAVASM